jgi:hypothetical protein
LVENAEQELQMREPLYRVTFDAATLLREHPPRMNHPHKQMLLECAYPAGSAPAGQIDVTRWRESVDEPIVFDESLEVQTIPNFYDYRTDSDLDSAVEWHVNFADPCLFVAYGSRLFAQDEMQAAEHPLLGSVREALLARGLSAMTSDESGATPILVTGVERRIEVATNPNPSAGRPGGLYGNRFADAPSEVVRRATRHIDPPTRSNIVAMAAPTGTDDYTESDIQYIFATAFTAFSAARTESQRFLGPTSQTIIHSGFWGCGAFGGNRKLMIALQTLAARAASVSGLVFHTGDAAGIEDAQRGIEVADSLASRCGQRCSLDTLVGRCVILGYRWGVSDGN